MRDTKRSSANIGGGSWNTVLVTALDRAIIDSTSCGGPDCTTTWKLQTLKYLASYLKAVSYSVARGANYQWFSNCTSRSAKKYSRRLDRVDNEKLKKKSFVQAQREKNDLLFDYACVCPYVQPETKTEMFNSDSVYSSYSSSRSIELISLRAALRPAAFPAARPLTKPSSNTVSHNDGSEPLTPI